MLEGLKYDLITGAYDPTTEGQFFEDLIDKSKTPSDTYSPKQIDIAQTNPIFGEAVERNLMPGEKVLGYTSDISFSENETNRRSVPIYSGSLASHLLMSGDLTSRFDSIAGWMQSAGFETGVRGWRINSDGTAEFESGYFRGDITGATGTFSGNISGGSIDIGTDAWHVDEDGNMWWGSSSTYAGATIKISSAGSVNFTTGTFSGAISGATITSSTITGGTIQTAATGYRIKLNGSNNKIEFLSGDTVRASQTITASGDLITNVTDDFIVQIGGTSKCGMFSGAFKPTTDGAYDLGESGSRWGDLFINGKIDWGSLEVFDSSGNFIVEYSDVERFRVGTSGKCRCGDTWESSDGTDGANESGYGFVNGIRSDGSDAEDLEYRFAEIDCKDGIITDFDEKSWDNIPHK